MLDARLRFLPCARATILISLQRASGLALDARLRVLPRASATSMVAKRFPATSRSKLTAARRLRARREVAHTHFDLRFIGQRADRARRLRRARLRD